MKLNLVICICAALIGVCSFVATNNPSALAIVLVAVISPIGSILSGKLLANKAKFKFELQPAATVGQELLLKVNVERASLFRGRIDFIFECHNLVTGMTKEVSFGLLPTAQEEAYSIPFNTECCGSISVSLLKVQSCDPMGFTSTSISGVNFSSTYTVYPAIYDLGVSLKQVSVSALMGSDYDRSKKGQDQTEVFDLQKFHDGDSLKRIHWKVSARLDQFMVRVPSRPSDHDLSLVCSVWTGDLQNEQRIEIINAVFSLTASISLSLLRQGLVHDVVYRSGDTTETNQVESRESFDSMLDNLMASSYPKEIDSDLGVEIVDEWLSGHTAAKTVFVTNFLAEAAIERLADDTSLSVIYIGEKPHINVASKGAYHLSYFAAEAVGQQIKSLEL